jgi:hypothetical protein
MFCSSGSERFTLFFIIRKYGKSQFIKQITIQSRKTHKQSILIHEYCTKLTNYA